MLNNSFPNTIEPNNDEKTAGQNMIYDCAECQSQEGTVRVTFKDYETKHPVATFAGLCPEHYNELQKLKSTRRLHSMRLPINVKKFRRHLKKQQNTWFTIYMNEIRKEYNNDKKARRHCISLNEKDDAGLTLEDRLTDADILRYQPPSNGRDYNMLREWYDERILAKMKLGYSKRQIFVYLRDEEQTMLNRRDLAKAIRKLECYLPVEERKRMREIQMKTGRPQRADINNELIKELRLKGLGRKRITQELNNRGIKVSTGTLQYRIKQVDTELLIEGIKITH